MSKNRTTCTAQETSACCGVDVGTVIDNRDCKASYRRLFLTYTEAQALLATLSERAQRVASEPCQVTSQFSESPQGVLLEAEFTFCCQAESLIFQLGLR